MEPFKQTYAIKEIKNAIAERLPFGVSDYSQITSLPDDLISRSSYGSSSNNQVKFSYSSQG